jgi:hypothetical protein
MKLEKLFKYSAEELKDALYVELINAGYQTDNLHNKNMFLYAEGDAPYMLVAHLDTVHKDRADIICYSKDGNFIMSPYGIGGDDRCGVFIILGLLKRLNFKPHIVFTMEEETGCRGATAFVNYMRNMDTPVLKYIVEYDRKGRKDCVFYQCDNRDFVDFVEKFGFKEATGTFSDISTIAPYFGVAAVNLSSGYYFPHTNHEVVCVRDMNNIIDASVEMFNTECDEFKYIQKKYTYNNYNNYNSYDRPVTVTLLPPNVAKIYDYNSDPKYRNNYRGEICVAEDGTIYKYSEYSKAYFKSYASSMTWLDNYVPQYDPNNTTTVYTY